MATDEKRPGPPDLEHQAPMCTLCLTEVSDLGNDGWDCETCGAYWPYEGRDGSWTNEEGPQCGGVIQPFLKAELKYENIRRNECRCLLTEDHEGDHQAEGFISWKRQH